MSTTTRLTAGADYRVTFARVTHGEWTKFWSLRSTWSVLTATVVLTLGIAGAVGWAQRDQGAGLPAAELVGGAFLGVDLFSLVIGVFGILMITSEHGSGLIRLTLVAVPRRWPVLWAKALVLAAVTFPVMLAVCFAAVLTSRAISGAEAGLGDPGVLRAVVGAAAAPVASGLLGLGVGAILRNTAGSITVLVAGTLVLPALLPAALPASLQDDVAPYSPVAASQAMYSIEGSGGPFEMLSPGVAALVTVGWVIVVLAAGGLLLRRRDA